MTVADFESYCQAQQREGAAWKDQREIGNMSLVNIAKAGIFSSDRARWSSTRKNLNLNWRSNANFI